MTEQMAIEHIRNLAGDYKCWDDKISREESLILCKLLDKLEQYRTLGTVEELRVARDKQIPNKPKHTLIKHGKHTWRKNKDGDVDYFAWDFGYHNGVVCEVCGETVCVNCNPEYDELTDCEEEYWDCPYCEKKIHCKSNYCDCGQKLDWSDEE